MTSFMSGNLTRLPQRACEETFMGPRLMAFVTRGNIYLLWGQRTLENILLTVKETAGGGKSKEQWKKNKSPLLTTALAMDNLPQELSHKGTAEV